MAEETLFKIEHSRSRSEIAEYLRRIADSLDDGGELSLQAGTDSVTVDPPERPTFEVTVEREGSADHPEIGVELEIEWTEGGDDGELRIE